MISVWYFLISSLVEILTMIIHFSSKLSEHLYNHYFDSLSYKSFIFILLKAFPEVLSCCFTLNIFLCFFISLTLCVGFYPLDKKGTCPSLEGIASLKR